MVRYLIHCCNEQEEGYPLLFKKQDYEALWDEVENELDTDVELDMYEDPNAIASDHSMDDSMIYDPMFWMCYPHRRRLF